MTRDETEFESAVHEALVERVGSERFELWFDRNVRLDVSASQLRVLAHEPFMLERIRSLFHSDLSAIASQVLGGDIQLAYEVDVALATDGDRSSLTAADAASVAPANAVPPVQPNRPRFESLGDFIEGGGNRLALTAADSVVQRMGSFSPLFLWGPPGTGKTHLLQGIWTAVRQKNQRALYLTAEQFTTMFVGALQGTGLPSFRHKCRNVDCLLVDDVHFFANKRATLVELQHTIDALTRDGRQMVLASHFSAVELSQVGIELATRVAGGLVCGMQPPDLETRRGILARFARIHQLQLHDSIIDWIADKLIGDARQLRGAINQIAAVAMTSGAKISMDQAQSALAEIIGCTQRMVQLKEIEAAVCDVFGLDRDSLQSERRSRVVSRPRMLAMWLARKYTQAVYSEIGDYFGHRSHSTVISAQKTVNQWRDEGAQLKLSGSAHQVDDVIRRVEVKLRLA